MYNKKAVSDVVSTVLIILLVVAAIAIIGAIVLNTVGKTSSKVDTAVACQSLDIKPTKCTLASGTASAIAERGAGGSDLTVTALTFVFTQSDGNTVTSAGTIPSTVGSTATGTATGAFSKVKTAATITLPDGTSATCDASPIEVSCV